MTMILSIAVEKSRTQKAEKRRERKGMNLASEHTEL
jgi:hypothetical protein